MFASSTRGLTLLLSGRWGSFARPSISSVTRSWPILLSLIATVLAILPIVFFGIPNHYDLAHHYQFAIPFYEAVSSGNLYPGWVAGSNHGFGDTAFRFYPPGLYYLFAACQILMGDWYSSTLLVVTLITAFGVLGTYFWTRSFLSRELAAVASALYAFMPYHVAELYQAALLAEYAAGGALLFAFAFTTRICDGGGRRDMAGLALSYGCLILLHLPLTLMGSVALLVYGLCSMKRSSAIRSLGWLLGALGLALAATAFYWATVLFELKWIFGGHSSQVSQLLDYRFNFIFSTFSADENISLWWMNILMIATLVMLLPALVLLRRSQSQPSSVKLKPLFFLTVFSVFMTTPLSRPVWSLLYPLHMVQHPFRWLAVTSTTVPILVAASVPFWWQKACGATRPLALLAVGVLAIPLAFTAGQTIRDANYLSRNSFGSMIAPLKDSPSINHWLPAWAFSASQNGHADELSSPPTMPSDLVEADGRTVTIQSWHSEFRRFTVSAGTSNIARIRTFYYPLWTASINGQAVPTYPDKDGVLFLFLPPEAVSVELAFREPRRAVASGVISAIGCSLILGIAIPRRKWR